MKPSAPTSQRSGPADATIPSVVVTALLTYRRRFGRIALAAILVFAPIDLIVTLATRAADDAALRAGVLNNVVGISSCAVSVAGTTLSVIFFAGVVERIVTIDQRGHEDAHLLEIVRSLPLMRLILLSILSTTLILAGYILFVVPGLILTVLFGIAGPVMVTEDRGVWATLRRSTSLIWPHFFLTLVLVLAPTLLEGALDTWVEGLSLYEQTLPHLAIDVAVTIVVAGLIGVVEVTLAHSLITDHERRHKAQPTPVNRHGARAGSRRGLSRPIMKLVVDRT